MLLVLFINSLNKLLAKAKELGILKPIAPRKLGTFISLNADDVVIFCHPDEAELCTVHEILSLFGEAYGLRTNYAQCSVSPIACSEEEALEVARVME
jgi:hypothetical protein